jgi:hypothetical protein
MRSPTRRALTPGSALPGLAGRRSSAALHELRLPLRPLCNKGEITEHS